VRSSRDPPRPPSSPHSSQNVQVETILLGLSKHFSGFQRKLQCVFETLAIPFDWGLTASYRILDAMLRATSPQTAVAVAGAALIRGRGLR
jgi:hypothetical protein